MAQHNILQLPLDDDIPPPPAYEPDTPLIKLEIRFLAGRPLTMELEEGFTCRVIKLRIEDARSIPFVNQTLVFNGTVLVDEATIGASGLRAGSQIYCLNVMPDENKAVVGVPADNLQVDCPTCGILIAVPPGMEHFQCPRCSTICSAPPRYVVPTVQATPVKRAPSKRALGKLGGGGGGGGGAPPRPMSSLAEEVRRKRELRLKLEASKNAAAAAAAADDVPPPPPMDDLPTTTQIQVIEKKGTIANLSKKEDQFIHQVINEDVEKALAAKRLELQKLNYPYGTNWLGFRQWLLMQCPLVNLWWMFEMCRLPPREERFPLGVEWFDCDTAKHGLIVGTMTFFLWFPFFIWGCSGLIGLGLMGCILGTFFGPLCLVFVCWDPECQRQCCNNCCSGDWGGGSGHCNCYCDVGDCDCHCCRDCARCDGGGCGSCGDCCSGCGDCCGKCCEGCGNCNCSGCDCGGCDC